MKRRLALGSIFALILAGCGGNDAATTSTKANPASPSTSQFLAVGDVSVSTTIVAKHSNKCMEIAAATGKTDQMTCNGQANQNWKFKDMGNSQYQLLTSTGQCLEVPSGSTADGVILKQAVCATVPRQLWTLQTEADGSRRIISVTSGKCVDVAGIQTFDGANIQQWQCLNQDNQRWIFQGPGANPPVTTFYTGPVNVKHTGKCLDVASASTADGATIDQLTCNAQANQSWAFKTTGGGQYQIVASHSNKCLDLPNGSTANATFLKQLTCDGSAKQLWTLEDRGGGYYKIHSVATNKCVDVAGQQTQDGVVIQQWDCVEQDNQLWKLGTGTPPAGTALPTIQGEDLSVYQLAFADEFNGSSLNTSVWNLSEWYEAPNPIQNFAVANGMLKIWPELQTEPDGSQHYFNRTLTTDAHYYQTYGFFEVRSKIPAGESIWPGFWLLNHDSDAPVGPCQKEYRPEIDVYEYYPQWIPDGITAFDSTIWALGNGAQCGNNTAYSRTSTTPGFHVYGLKWEASRITYYYDGQQVFTYNVSMPSRMYLLLQLWFTDHSASKLNPTGSGNSHEIDYIRAWTFR